MSASAEDRASRPGLGCASHAVTHLLDLQVSRRMKAMSAAFPSRLHLITHVNAQASWEGSMHGNDGHGAAERLAGDRVNVLSALAQTALVDADAEAITEHAVQLSQLTGQVSCLHTC
jgi:hypothetical protein